MTGLEVERYEDLDWDYQEAAIDHIQVFLKDGALYITYRVEDRWVEPNTRAGEATIVSETYATYCVVYKLAVDPVLVRAHGHSEDGCFSGGIDRHETMLGCDLLVEPNEGSCGDVGEES